MKHLIKLHLIFLLLVVTSCIKIGKNEPTKLQVTVKNIFTNETISGIKVNLNSYSGGFNTKQIIARDTLTSDAEGHATFVDFVVKDAMEWKVFVNQSNNYSSSEHTDVTGSEAVLFVYPLLTKKVIIKKPSSIKSYNIRVSSDSPFYYGQELRGITSTIETFVCKFVPEVANLIYIREVTLSDSIVSLDRIPLVTPARNDTSTIEINL